MNNNTNNIAAVAETATETTIYAYISEWMRVDQANDWMQCLITEGTYTKKQLKKSSPRFANGKDKTDGYEVRVIAVSGIHPELEKAIVGYRKMMEKKVKVDTTQLHIWKNLLKLENIARDENGQLKISDKCVWLADGTRIQLFTKKA